MILEKMERQHPSTLDERRQIKLRPVLTVQMPPSPGERRRALYLLKFMTNELKIVVVVVGTSDAFRSFVVAYGKLLPLRKPSPFDAASINRVSERLRAAALVNSIDAPGGNCTRWPAPPTLRRLYESWLVDRLVLLSRLSPPACTALWTPVSGWELREFTFRA